MIEEIETPTSLPLYEQAGIIEGAVPTTNAAAPAVPIAPLARPAVASASRKRRADELSSEHLKRMHFIAPGFDSSENNDAMEMA